MDQRVKHFLDQKKYAEELKDNSEKEKILIDLNLYDKKYSPYSYATADYPYSEWDSDRSEYKFYRKVAIEVTDEEFREIRKYAKSEIKRDEETEPDQEGNPVAVALTCIAWLLFLGGLIAGIAFGTTEVETGSYYNRTTETEFSFAVAFIYWISAFISGTFFLGLAEIIKLLTHIRENKNM